MGAVSVFTTGNYHCQLRSKQKERKMSSKKVGQGRQVWIIQTVRAGWVTWVVGGFGYACRSRVGCGWVWVGAPFSNTPFLKRNMVKNIKLCLRLKCKVILIISHFDIALKHLKAVKMGYFNTNWVSKWIIHN